MRGFIIGMATGGALTAAAILYNPLDSRPADVCEVSPYNGDVHVVQTRYDGIIYDHQGESLFDVVADSNDLAVITVRTRAFASPTVFLPNKWIDQTALVQFGRGGNKVLSGYAGRGDISDAFAMVARCRRASSDLFVSESPSFSDRIGQAIGAVVTHVAATVTHGVEAGARVVGEAYEAVDQWLASRDDRSGSVVTPGSAPAPAPQ